MLGDSLRRRHGPDHDPEDRDEGPADRRPAPPEKGGGDRSGILNRLRGGRPAWLRVPAIGLEWAIAALVVLTGSFLVGYLLSTQVLFPKPATAGSGIPVPALYGETRATAETRIRSAGLAVGEVRELASRAAVRGTVLAQDPVPGQQLMRGGAVSLAVSQGPPVVRVPPVRGLGVKTATGLLEELGFQVVSEPLRDPSLPAGAVVRTEPAAGTMRELPSRVTLLVVAGEPVDTLDPGVRPVGSGRPARSRDTTGTRPTPEDAWPQ